MRNTLAAVALGATALTMVASSKADAAVVTALYLAIDGSGSISGSDFLLQRNAYVNLLANVTTDGTVAIGVNQFSHIVQSVFNLTVIDSVATRNSLIAAIGGMAQIGSLTDISGAIAMGASELTGLAGVDCTEDTVSCLIDVSTDGAHNANATSPSTASANAIAAGVDAVNCLGVGGAANCSFIAGTGSFSVTANSFLDFEGALRKKLAREGVIPDVPLPAPFLMLGGGLLALFGLRRRASA